MSDFRIVAPGIYDDIDEHDYHADPCPTPSLSNSLIRPLLDKSPLHAAYQHPRLFKTKENTKDPSKAMDKGTLLHDFILGKGPQFHIIHFDNFLKQKAKDQKAEALENNKIPILEKDYNQVSQQVEMIKEKIKNHPACEGFFSPGKTEVTLAWQEQDIWCRSRLDCLPDDETYPIFDLKSTSRSAAPQDWKDELMKKYRTQAVFYNRGLIKLGQKPRPPMRFVVVELSEPCEVCVFSPSEELELLAEQEIERAIGLWRHCLSANHWTSYPHQIIEVRPTPWIANQIEEQEILFEAMGGI